MLFAIAALVAGVWIIVIERRDLALAWQSRRWPSVIGRITDKRFHRGEFLGMTNDGTGAPVVGKWLEVELVYSYQVAGTEYSSTRFDFSGYGRRFSSRYYEDDEEVPVYYCPSNPSNAVLHPGLHDTLFVGPLLILGGLGFLPFLF
jgi:hypothetical protein